MSTPDVPAPAGASFPPAPAVVPVAVRRTPVWVPAALTVLGAACLIAMVPLFRHGVVDHAFPSYVRGDPAYEVRRYSAPWIAGAVALGGVGIVCWAVAAGLLRPGRRTAVDAVPHPIANRPDPVDDVADRDGLAPRPTEAAREY